MKIKEKFEKLSLRKIIQLYLIVIMFYGLLFIFYKDVSAFIYPENLDTSFVDKISKVNKQYSKKLSDLELITYFNDNVKSEIKETKILQNTIEIKMIGTFKNMMNFLNIVSYNFKIKEFEIKKSNQEIDLSIRLEREVFHMYEANNVKKEKIVNPFTITKTKIKVHKPLKIKVNAIVGAEVLVNDTWHKKGDRIKEYLIKSIKKNVVVFIDIKTKKQIIKSLNYE